MAPCVLWPADIDRHAHPTPSLERCVTALDKGLGPINCYVSLGKPNHFDFDSLRLSVCHMIVRWLWWKNH
jgi:hypothetical protein